MEVGEETAGGSAGGEEIVGIGVTGDSREGEEADESSEGETGKRKDRGTNGEGDTVEVGGA